MVAALTQYRDTSRKEDGYVRFELLEQVGRSGHVAVVEVWKDQKAFDYDQRPYKTLTVAPATAAGNGQAIHVVSIPFNTRLDLSRSRDERADSSHRERLPQVSRIPVD